MNKQEKEKLINDLKMENLKLKKMINNLKNENYIDKQEKEVIEISIK